MFGMFRTPSPRRRQTAVQFGVTRSALEMLEDRVLLDGVGEEVDVDHDHEHEHEHEDHFPHITDFSDVAPELLNVEMLFEAATTFELSSKPDSNYTIYLDFDGHTTFGNWNSNPNDPPIVHSGYDTDGDLTSFSAQELTNIQRIWAMVADDFAPFDVNVTTMEPPVEDLINSGGSDTRWGARALMTINDFGVCAGCGGIAQISVFDRSWDSPAYVFNGTRSNGGIFALSETISHEVGHNLGLGHDGLSGSTYYSGHGTGPEGWGPIMGAPFSKVTSHWSNGDYFDGSNTQDDLTIITTTNGFGYRQDDYGDSRGGATVFVPVGGTVLNFDGIIERTADIDYIRFEAGTGTVSFDISAFSDRPNLNVFAAIYDSSGTLIAQANPKDNPGATISASVTTGVYYLRIEGVGSDDVYNPATDRVEAPVNPPFQQANPLGFSDYGSLGFYSVAGTVPAARADFGDAPDSYGTLFASNGPSHLDTGPILGALRDGEADGAPGTNANGDDIAGGDDEDGVVFLNSLVPGTTARVSISSITGGVLDAWIDFDGNGTFDPGEQVIIDFDLPIGATEFSIPVPDSAKLGTTYARFRIAATAFDVDSPLGAVNNGEVEDYQLTVKPRQVINEVLFDVPDDNTGKEYIELRSAPGTVIENGTYLIVVEGDGNGGTVDMLYNLSGLVYGSNGYLVLLQKDSPYLPDAASTVVRSTQVGWRDQGARVAILGFSENNLENGSQTYFLAKAPTRPLLGGDIDANNDGTPDGVMYSSWDILDSVGFVDANAGDQVYGAVNFRTNGAGLAPVGSVAIDSGAAPLRYIGRNLISQGSAAAGWVGGLITAGAPPIWTLSGTTPGAFNGRPLDHIGSLNFDQLDYGDLPDSYLTSKGVGGASHGLGGPILGATKDVESNGKPSVNADGDDGSSSDDEDGVNIPALVEGTAGIVSVVISNVAAGTTVQGWFDWNADGDFLDAGEAAISQAVTVSGAVTFSVTAPVGTFDNTNGTTYARFRVSSSGGLGSAGAAVDGEVEDYKVTILTSATDDFGDAPLSYGTTLAGNGARHTGVGPTLGALRDIERDGNPSGDALGDDNFKLDDEDGVFISTAISPGFTSVAIVNAPTGGVLDAWLDTNKNGVFDAGEQVITNAVLTAGDNSVNFAVPGGALTGQTFMRFRIASAATDVTSPVGPASNGEVEDYRVEILPIFNRVPTISGGTFTLQENSPNDTVVGSVIAADPDPGQTLTYAITRGNFGGAFKINPTTGEISVAATEWVDFEINSRFDLEVTVTDNGTPKLSALTTVRIDLTDVADGISLVVREGDAVGTRFGRIPATLTTPPRTFTIVNGNTNGAFIIDGEGIISVANSAALDFETQPVFELEIFVTDGFSNTEQVFVTVKVLDRNEAPETTDYTFQIMESVNNGAAVGKVVATDDDRGQTLTYSIFSGNEAGIFAIDQQGNITVANGGKLKYAEKPIHDLVISISDSAEVPFTVASKVRIYVRQYALFETFNNGSLGPKWSTNSPSVNVVGQKLSIQQPTAAPAVLTAVLDIELREYDDMFLQFLRTIVGADATGSVQISDDGGSTWFTINTFNGAINPVGLQQRVLINLTEAARAAGRELRGRTLIRFTTNTQNQNSGVLIDNLLITGRVREKTADDVLLYDESSNSFKLGFSDGNSFVYRTSAWAAGSDWQFVYGDFNNDQRLDVAGFSRGTDAGNPSAPHKRWMVGLSTGSALVVRQWADWDDSTNWEQVFVGDFNGDGFDDVGAQTATGQTWIGYSLNGERFVTRSAVNWQASGVRVSTGDINNDGFDDLVGLRANNSLSIALGTATAGTFTYIPNAGMMPEADNPLLVNRWEDLRMGDFDGDGRLELSARKYVVGLQGNPKSNGQIWIGQFSAGLFAFRYGTKWSDSVVWSNVLVTDFNNDGRDDLVGVTADGDYWGALSNGVGLTNQYFGRSAGNPGYTVAGDFNNDGHVDLATFYTDTNSWIAGLGGGTRPAFTPFGGLPLAGIFKRPGAGTLD